MLTVNGNYVGSGGTIVFNTVLGDSSSATDKMIVNGNTSGQTGVRVVNAGGLGAQTTGNGIQLIQVNGASNGTFSLTGRVSAGAFNYNLFQGGVGADDNDGDWYLRSSGPGGGLRAEVPVDASIPSLVSTMGLALMGTMEDRGGNGAAVACADDAEPRKANSNARPANGQCQGAVLWSRVLGQVGSVGGSASNGSTGTPAYSYGLGGLQAGADLLHTAQDRAGFYGSFGTLHGDIRGFSGGTSSSVNFDAYALGGYWTHRDNSGWYTDLVLQEAFYQDINASTTGGDGLSTHGNSLTVSAETGYRIGLGNGWAVIPQGQLIYQRTSIAGTSDAVSLISYGATDEVYGRLGARVTRDWTSLDGRTTQIFGEFNVWDQLGDKNAKTTFTNLDGAFPTAVSSLLGGSWAQLKVGMAGQMTKNTSVFAAVDGDVPLDHTGYAVGGHVGFRAAW